MSKRPWSTARLLRYVRLTLASAPDPELDRDSLRVIEEKLSEQQFFENLEAACILAQMGFDGRDVAVILGTLQEPQEPLETAGLGEVSS